MTLDHQVYQEGMKSKERNLRKTRNPSPNSWTFFFDWHRSHNWKGVVGKEDKASSRTE